MEWSEVKVSGNKWHQHWNNAPMPLQQSTPYGLAMMAFGGTQKQYVYGDIEDPKAVTQVMERKGYGIILSAVSFFGPHWKDPSMSYQEKFEALKSLKSMYPKLRGKFLALMPFEKEGDIETQNMMKELGLKKTISGYSTIWVNLEHSEDKLREELKGKWRNALVSAEKAGLEVSFGGRKPLQYNWLLEQEDSQRLNIKYTGLPTELVGHYALAGSELSSQPVFTVTAFKGKEKVAGQLYLLHGSSATYFIGWNGDEGRKLSAHNLLLFEAMKKLRSKGVKWLDLGGVNTEEGAGIARFKLGVGVPPHSYAGSFV